MASHSVTFASTNRSSSCGTAVDIELILPLCILQLMAKFCDSALSGYNPADAELSTVEGIPVEVDVLTPERLLQIRSLLRGET